MRGFGLGPCQNGLGIADHCVEVALVGNSLTCNSPHGVIDCTAPAVIANSTITNRRRLPIIGAPIPRAATDGGRDGSSRGSLHGLDESRCSSGRGSGVFVRRLLLLELLEVTLMLLVLLCRHRRGSIRLLFIRLELLGSALR